MVSLKNRYNNPWILSLKDYIAITFLSFFFFAGYQALSNPQALALVQSLIIPLGLILTCYFTQEGLTMYYMQQSGTNPYQQAAIVPVKCTSLSGLEQNQKGDDF